jgi:hypothetical protein
LNETSSVWLFATPKETIKEIKMRIGGGRKIEILGSGGPKSHVHTRPAALAKTISEVGGQLFSNIVS